MIDREKIIRAVETCFDSWIDKHRNMGLDLREVEQMKCDALGLLKESEPIKPYAQGDGSFACDNCGETVGWEEMNCGGFSMVKYKYCPECGRKVKWDG